MMWMQESTSALKINTVIRRAPPLRSLVVGYVRGETMVKGSTQRRHERYLNRFVTAAIGRKIANYSEAARRTTLLYLSSVRWKAPLSLG